jgi:vitamin B12 transporter
MWTDARGSSEERAAEPHAMRRLVTMAAWLAPAWPVLAFAQEEAPLRELSPVVVTASALPLTEATVNQHVSVYTREQIEREAPGSISEFLTRRAGTVIDRTPGSGGFGSLFLRGADPSHVVVLIDGIRQNDPLSSRGSAVDLNTLTLDDVERIEVVRGNSTVAHSEALAGVVQIFTRAPRDTAPARVTAEAGGQGLAAASASIAHGPWHAGVAQREDGEASISGFSRTRAANFGFRDRWGGTHLNAQLRLADSKNLGFPDDSGGPLYAVNRTLEERRADAQQLAFALDHELNAANALELRAARNQRDTEQSTPRVPPGVRDPFGLPAVNTDGRYVRNEIQANWRWHSSAGLDLLFGAGSQSETGTLDSTIFLFGARVPTNFDIHRVTNSLVGEARKAFGPWSLQLGLRHEHTSGEESLTHPALSFQYQPTEDSGRVGMALSSASKLPSFYALGNPLVGNPELKPEHSRQAEIYWASAETAPWKARITLFAARYKDLVDFDPGPPPKLVNRASIHSDGIEFSLSHRWQRGLTFYTQGTLMNVSVPEGGPPLRFRPRQQASAGLEAQLAPQWRLQSGITYIGPRFDSSIPTGEVELGGYSTVNLALTWQGIRWQAFAAVDNALNHQGEETVGMPIPERRLRVGVRWNL